MIFIICTSRGGGGTWIRKLTSVAIAMAGEAA
jgi:hypothetical protein